MTNERRTVSERLLDGVLVHGGQIEREEISQEQFWKAIGIGKTRGTKIRDVMLQSGLLQDLGEGNRMRTRMAFGKGLGYVLGVSVGSESLRAALVDANGHLLATSEDEASFRRARARPEQLLEDIAACSRALLEDALRQRELLMRGRDGGYLPLLGVAVAWPTPLHRLTKIPTGKSLHPDWATGESLPIRVAKRLGLTAERSSALNDANACAFSVVFDDSRADGEQTDVHRGWVAIVLRIGGGVGAATMLVEKYDPNRSAFTRSQLVEGTHGLAGELGHLTIPSSIVADLNRKRNRGLAALDPNAECRCGGTGHLESLASVAALADRIAASPALDPDELGLLADARRQGPPRMQDVIQRLQGPASKSALQDVGQLLGHALAGPILMLNPRRITLVGSLAHPHVEDGLRMARGAWSSSITDDPDIDRPKNAHLNRYAAARGAALAVFREQVYRCFDVIAAQRRVDVVELRPADLPKIGLAVRTHDTTEERLPAARARRGRR